MYSANLTSLLARPARERPIGTLPDLEEAMRDYGYDLVVESHSSSLAILEVSIWIKKYHHQYMQDIQGYHTTHNKCSRTILT